jgi:predicted DNA-binding transcriptional regulator YafY
MAARNDDLAATLSQLMPQDMNAVWLGALLTARLADTEIAAAAKRITNALEAIRASTIDAAAINRDADAGGEVAAAKSLTHHLDIHALRQALVHELKLRIEYVDAKDRTTKRTVWPLDVQDYGPNDAMLAWCEKRADFRNFRFDRIIELAIIHKRFEAPRSVMLAFYGSLRNARSSYDIEQ